MRDIVLAILLFVIVSSTFAQDAVIPAFLSVREVPMSEPIFFSYDYRTEHSSATYNSIDNTFAFLIKGIFTEIDLNQRSISRVDSLDLPEWVNRVGYSPFHKGYLFWDHGLGRVFMMDSNRTISRIDNSYEWKSQHFHLPWIHPKTGELFAFGGYGLFTDKSIIVSFNSETRQWNLVEVKEPEKGPSPNRATIGVADLDRDHLYVFVSKTPYSEYGVNNLISTKLAIWRYTLSERTWKKLTDLSEKSRVPVGQSATLMSSSHPTMPFFVYPLSGEDFYKNLCFFHTDLLISRCTVIHGMSSLTNEHITNIFWSDVDKAYYIVKATLLVTSYQVKISFLQLKIEDEEALMAWIEEDQGNKLYANPLVLTGVVLLLVGIVWMIRRRVVVNKNSSDETSEHKVMIELGTKDCYVLRSEHAGVIEVPALESKLLSLLLQNVSNPDSFVKSDTIDEHLLPDHPSHDYIRRIRNITLEKLESLFQLSRPIPNDTYILRRTSTADKRKNEYRLNDKIIGI